MPANAYLNRSFELNSPAQHAAAVTPHDSTDLTTTARYLYVGTAGDVSLETVGGDSAIVFTAVPAGTVLPVVTTRVNSTSTTASNIVALW